MKILLTIVGLIIIGIALFLLGFIIGYVHGAAPNEESLWPPDHVEPETNLELYRHRHFHRN